MGNDIFDDAVDADLARRAPDEITVERVGQPDPSQGPNPCGTRGTA